MASAILNKVNDAAFDLLVAEHAAWTCGRLVRAIEHFMQIAWLTGGVQARTNIDAAFGDLGVASRALLGTETSRAELRERVAAAEQAWKSQYGSEWHAELLWETEARLRCATHDGCNSDEEVVELHCKELLGSVSEIVRSLRNRFSESISSELFECFCLAECVGQAVHPVPAYRYLTFETESAGDAGWAVPIQRRTPKLLPQLPVRIEELTQAQWDEIWWRWRHLELETELLAPPVNTHPTPTALSRYFASCFANSRSCRTDHSNEPHSEFTSDEDLREEHESMQAERSLQVGQQSEDFATRSEDHPLITVSSRANLGLTLEGHVLRRRGFVRQVLFQHPLLCNLMRELLLARRNCLNYSEIGHRWRQLGATCPTADRATVRAEFMRLGAMLRPLNLCIRGTSDGGWSLCGGRVDPELLAIMAESQ